MKESIEKYVAEIVGLGTIVNSVAVMGLLISEFAKGSLQ